MAVVVNGVIMVQVTVADTRASLQDEIDGEGSACTPPRRRLYTRDMETRNKYSQRRGARIRKDSWVFLRSPVKLVNLDIRV